MEKILYFFGHEEHSQVQGKSMKLSKRRASELRTETLVATRRYVEEKASALPE